MKTRTIRIFKSVLSFMLIIAMTLSNLTVAFAEGTQKAPQTEASTYVGDLDYGDTQAEEETKQTETEVKETEPKEQPTEAPTEKPTDPPVEDTKPPKQTDAEVVETETEELEGPDKNSAAKADDYLSARWMPSNTTVNNITTYNDDPPRTIVYQLNFHNSTTYSPGEIVIRVPYSLYTASNGKVIPPEGGVSIPLAPGISNEYPFNYTIDEATNEMIITNAKEVNSGTNNMLQISYSIDPSKTANGQSLDVKPKMTLKGATGTVSNNLSGRVTIQQKQTEAPKDDALEITSLTKTKPSGADSETFLYTPENVKTVLYNFSAPADFDSYYYVAYNVAASIKTTGKVKYQVSFNDVPNGGAVVGYKLGAYTYLTNPAVIDGESTSTGDYTRTVSGKVVVRYPKTAGTTLRNKLTVDVDQKDGNLSDSETVDADDLVWKDYNFDEIYKGDGFTSQSKAGGTETDGVKNYKEASEAGTDYTLANNWLIKSNAQAYKYLKDNPGGSYQHVIEDGNLTRYYQGGSNIYLNQDDYYFQSVSISRSEQNYNPANGFSSNANTTGKINFEIMVRSNPGVWKLVTTGYSSTGGDLMSLVSNSDKADGVYKFRITNTGIRNHISQLDIYVKMVLRHDSAAFADIPNVGSTTIYNTAGTSVVTNQGGYLGNTSTSGIYTLAGLPPEQIPSINSWSASHGKSYKGYINDTIRGRVLQDWELSGAETGYGTNLPNMNESEISRNEAYFYELLPPSTFLDPTEIPTVSGYSADTPSASVSYTITDNYKGSGRQLIKFHVKTNSKNKNYSLTNGASPVITGFKLKFRTYYHWVDHLNANKQLNHSAYQPVSGSFFKSSKGIDSYGAYPDLGTGAQAPVSTLIGNDGKPIMNDLAGNGSVDESIKNTVYAKAEQSATAIVSGRSGVSKSVRGEIWDSYGNEAVVSLGNTYSYRITAQSSMDTSMKDLVIFDRLENAPIDRAGKDSGIDPDYWQGEFVGVDVSEARAMGINAVVYYSTDRNAAYDLSSGQWSTDMPAPSDVKAIAVDLTQGRYGEQIYAPNASVSISITMKAPDTLQLPARFSYNNPAFNSSSRPSVGFNPPWTSEGVVEGSTVKTRLIDPTTFEVSKQLLGTGADQELDFTFTAKVKRNGESGFSVFKYQKYTLYTDGIPEELYYFTNAEGEFKLKHNQKAVFEQVEGGDQVQIQEKRDDSNSKDLFTYVSPANGYAEMTLKGKDQPNKFEFVNRYGVGAGETVLGLEKNLIIEPGVPSPGDPQFTFQLLINNAVAPQGTTYKEIRKSTGVTTPRTITSTDGTFLVRQDHRYEFQDLSIGNEYKFIETVPVGYTNSYIYHEGTLDKDGATAKFTNYYYGPNAKIGNLEIEKVVTTAPGITPSDEAFVFQLEIGNEPYKSRSYTLYEGATEIGVRETNVLGRFEIKNGQKAVFSNLLKDKKYLVREITLPQDYEYETPASGSLNGTIKEGSNEAKFTNKYTPKFDVDYRFISSDSSIELPQVINDLLPDSHERIDPGTTVTREASPALNHEIRTEDGLWVLTNWDKDDVTIVDRDEEFVGTWTFYKDPDPVKGYDVTVNKSADKSSATVVSSGDVITYKLTVKNTGLVTVPFTVVKDVIPEGTTYEANSADAGGVFTDAANGNPAFVQWIVTDLAPNAQVDLTFKVKVNASNLPDRIKNVGLYKSGDTSSITPDVPTNEIIHTTDPSKPIEAMIDAVKSSNPVSGATVKPGDTIAYTIKVTNTGGSPGKDIYVKDYLPTGTTHASGGTFVDAATSSNGRAYVEWKIASLAAGASQDVTFNVTVDAPNNGRTIRNQALYENRWVDSFARDPKNATNIVRHPMGTDPVNGYDVTVNKKGSVPANQVVRVGDRITYTLTVKNTGLETAPFTVVKDPIPQGTGYVAQSASHEGVYVPTAGSEAQHVKWVIKDLEPNQEVQLTFRVEVLADPPTYIYNVGYYGTGDTEDPDPNKPTNPITNTTDEEEPVAAVIDAVKSSTPVSGSKVKAGDTITYTMKVTNTGGVKAKDVYVRDYVPAGTTYKEGGTHVAASNYVEWKIATLEPGASQDVTFKVTVNTPNDGRSIKNQALFEKDWDGTKSTDPENSTNVVKHTVGTDPIDGYTVTVNKTGDRPAKTPVNPGEAITYTLTAKNTGLVTAPFTIIKDEIPDGTTYVASSASDGGTFVAATGTDKAYVKWVIADLAPGAQKPVTFQVTVNTNPPTYITNVGHYGTGDTEDETDPTKPTNPITNTTDPDEPVGSVIDVIKSSTPATGTEVKAGNEITYTMKVTNTGGSTARNIYVRDYVPTGTTYKEGGTHVAAKNYVEWKIASLLPGASQDVTFKVTVDAPNNGRTIKNQARYEDGWDDTKTTDPENSTNIVVHPVGTEPQQGYDVTVKKSGSVPASQKVSPGDQITYTLKVKNTGAAMAPFTVVKDEIPEGTSYVDGTASIGGSYTEAAGNNKAFVKWVVKDLEPDQEVTLTFTVKVETAPPTYIYNIGYYGTGNTEDPDPNKPTNPITNTTDEEDPVNAMIDAVKSSTPAAGTEVSANQDIAYTIKVSNTGGLAAKNVYVRDYIPEGTKYVGGSADSTGGTYVDTAASVNGKAYVEWTLATLAANADQTVGFSVRVDGPNDGRSIRNQAYFDHNWDGSKAEPDNSTNIVKHPVKVDPVKGYEVTVNKSGSVPAATKVITGDRITYTLKVKNTGLNIVPFTVVKDEIPEGTAYVADSADNGGTYVPANGSEKAYVKWVIKDLAPNTEIDLTFKVEVASNPPTFIFNVGHYGTGDTEDPDPNKPTNPVINTTDEESPVNAIVDVVKSATPVSGSTVKAGSDIIYNLKITNTGGIEAKNIYVKDYIPAGTTYVDASVSTGGSYIDKVASTNGKDYVQWTIAKLNAGATVNVSFKVKADAPNDGRIIHNQALYQKDWKPTNTDEPENSTNVVRHPVGEEPVNGYEVTVNKSGSVPAKDIVAVNDEITYTLKVKNTGLVTVPFTVVKDEIPEGTTYVTDSASDNGTFKPAEGANKAYVQWTVADLAPNAVKEISFTVKVNPNPPTYIRNIGHYNSGDKEDEIDPDKPTNPITNTTDEENPVTAAVDVVKAASPVAGTTVKAGEEILYTLDVKNTGGVAARNVYVKDYIPDGVTYVDASVSTGGAYVDADTSTNGKAYVDWKIAVIAPGATATVSFKVKADAPNNGRTIRNQALYENNWDGSKTADPENSTNIVKHPMGLDPVRGHSVTVNKSGSVPASTVVKAGDKITYTLKVKNTGMETVPFTVVKDEIPEGTAYVADSVSGDGTFTEAAGSDNAFVKWTVKDLAPNAEVTLTFTVEVTQNPPTYIFNIGYYGTGDEDTPDPDPNKPTNPITNTTDEDNPISAIVDAVKSSTPISGTEVKAGDDIAYNIKVTNTGGSKAENVYIKDYIPAGTKYVQGSADSTGGTYVDTAASTNGKAYVEWKLASLNADANATVGFQVRVDEPNDGRSIRNQALYETNWNGTKTTDPENGTNIVQHPVKVSPVQGYDVTVNKSGSVPASKIVAVGDYITYTLKVKNTGLNIVPFTVVKDEIPEGTAYVAASADNGGTYVPAAGVDKGYVKWVVEDLAPNAEISLTFKVQVQTAPPTFIYNIGQYGTGNTEDEVDPKTPTNPIINTTDEENPVSPVIDVVKSANPISGATVKAGNEITYTLKITNTGGVTAKNIYLKDYIPAGATYVDSSVSTGGSYVDKATSANGKDYVQWTVATLKAGASTDVSFKVKVDEPNDGRILRNQALYENNWDPSNNNEPGSSTNIVKHPVGEEPVNGYDVTVNKSGNVPATQIVAAGDEITYTLKVKNTGLATVPFTIVKDEIPEGTTYVADSASDNGTFTEASGGNKAYVQWTVADLAPEAVKEISFKVKVNPNPPTYIRNIGHYNSGDKEEDIDPDKPTNPVTNTTDEENPVNATIDGVKSASPAAGTTVKADDEITYTLKMTNTGGIVARNVYVRDYIPAGVTYVDSSASTGGAFVDAAASANGKAYVNWTIARINPGATAEVTFKVKVDAPNNGRIVQNQALYENNWDGTKNVDPENSTNIVKHPMGLDPVRGYDVTVNKSGSVPASQIVKTGDKITYTLVVKNTGMETVPFTVVKDELPEGTTYVTDSASEGGTFVPAANGNKAYVQWTVKDLDPNTQETLTFTVEVDQNPPTYIYNVGHYGSGDDEDDIDPDEPTNPITNTTDEDNPISAIVDAVKSATPAAGTEVMAGDDITYSIKVTNTGGSKAEKVYVKDYIPAGTKYVAGSADSTGGKYVAVNGGRSYVEWTIGSIAPEADATVSFQVRVDEPNDGRSIRNQAVYENNWDGTKTVDPENATNIVKHPVGIDPVQGYDITVNKSGSVPSSQVVAEGDYITYTLTVKNTGLINVPFTIVQDEIPEGTAYVAASADNGGTYVPAAGGNKGYVKWVLKNVAPNTGIDLTFKVQVQTAPPTFIYNVGMYGSGETEEDADPETPTNPIINTTDEEDPVAAVVDVIKSSNPASGSTVKAGNEITYTLKVVNTGGVTARNIYLKDYIPAGTTYVDSSVSEGGTFVDSAASASGNAYAEWKIATLKAGASTNVSFKVTVDEPNDGRTIRNQALYEKDWDGSKNTEPENSTNIVKHPVGLNPVNGYEVTVNKSGSVPATTIVKAGDEITYTLKVKNTGMDMVPFTVVTDEIPEGTTYVADSASGEGTFVPAAGSDKAYVKWTVKDLEADAEVTLTFKVTVDQNPPTYIFNVGYYGSGDDEDDIDPKEPTNPITNTTDEEDPISAIIDVVKSSAPIAGTELMAGDEITYTLKVTNTGGLRANNVYVKDLIPVGSTFVETAEGTYVDTNGAPYVEWKLLTLDAGATKELSFKVTVDEPNDGRSIRNQALYENNWDGTKTTPENTTNIVKHPVGTDPIKGYDVTVNKSGSVPATTIVKTGDEITYTLTVKNTGLETAPFTTVKDEIPLGTTYVADSASEGGTFTAAEGTNRAYVQWKVKDLPANSQVQLTFKVKVNDNPPTYIYNIGTYGTGDSEDPDPDKPTNPITNTTDDKEPVNAIIDVIKSSTPPADKKVMAGDTITYNLKVMNTGGRLAKDVYVKDYIPTGTKFVAGSADSSGGTYVDAAASATSRPYVEWKLDSLKAQATKDLTFQVRVDEPNNGRIIRNQAMYQKDWDPTSPGEPENNTNIVKHPVGIDPVEGYDVTVNKYGSVPASQKVQTGDEITYTLKVKNTGLETAPFTIVKDEIPDGTTYVDGSATAGGVYTAAANGEKAYVQWTVTDLEPDTEETLTFKVTVNTNPPTYIYNIGYYGTGDDEDDIDPKEPTNPITNTTDEEDPVGPIIDSIKASVPVSDSEVKAGDTITYTMTVTNTGGSTAKNIYVKDYVPAGTTYVEGGTLVDADASVSGRAYVEWKIATLAKGASKDVTFKVTVDEPNNGRTIRNQALYESNWDGTKKTEPENATNVVKHPVTSTPVKGYDVTVNKRSNPTSSVEVKAGDEITYTLAVKNSGLDTVPFTVVRDEIPEGTTYVADSANEGGTYFPAEGNARAYIQWTVADLEPETISELSFKVTVDQNPPAFIYNVGQYGSGDVEEDITPDKPTNQITHTTDEKNPVGAIIDVVKSASPMDGTEVKAGDEVVYKLKVENTGGTTAKRVYVRDYIPAGVTFEGTVDPVDGNYVAADASANGRAYVEWTIPKLAKGEIVDLSFKVLVDEPNDGRSIKNHALYQKDWDPNNTADPNNSTNVVKHPVKTDPVKGYDVTVNKRADKPGAIPLKAGDEITYSLTVRNSGVVDVPFTIVKDLIPEGTTYVTGSASTGGAYTAPAGSERGYVQWTLTDLEPDQEVTVSFKVVINQNPPTFIYNVGLYGTGDEESTTTPDKPTNPITHTTDEDDPVNAVVDVIKSANPTAGTEVMAGDEVTYTLKVVNSGGITARDVYVRDYVPTGTTYVDGGTFVSAEDSANGKPYVEWKIAKLAKNSDTEVSFTVSIDAPNNGRSIRNQALYEDNWDGTKTTEPEHGTNVVKHPVGVDPINGYDVTVNKKGDRPGSEVLAEGDEITYTLTVANTGLETAPFTIVKDEIPEGTSYVADSVTENGVYVDATADEPAYVRWVITDLDPDQTVDLSFKVVIDPEPPIFITNIGMYTTGDSDDKEPDKPTNPVTNTTDEENPVNAVIEVVKGSNPKADSKVKVGDEIEYTLKVKNIGGIAARNVYVRDYVPVGTTYVEGGTFVDAETSANGRAYVEWFFSRVKADEEKDLSFKVTVDGPNDGRTVRNQALFAKDWDVTKTEDPEGKTNIVRHPMETDPVKGYDVTVNKSSVPTGSKVVKAGETIEYVLNVKNTGLVTAPFTVVRDEIPAGTTYVANSASPNDATFIRADVAENGKAYVQWIVPNLRPTAEVKLSFKVTVNENPPTFIHNVGLYGAGDNENIVPEEPTNPITHSTDEDHPVGAVIDVVKKANPQYGATVRAGEEITYTMEVINNGGTTAKDIYVKDYIPAGTTYADGGKFVKASDSANGIAYVEWKIEKLAAGAKQEVSFKVKVNKPNDGRTIRNQALYEKDWDGTKTEEPGSSTNIVKHPVGTDPVKGYDVTVNKRGSVPGSKVVKPGDKISYTLTAKNTGLITAPFTTVRDEIPAGTTYVAGSASEGGVYVAAEQSANGKAYVQWIVKDLQPNQEKVMTFSITVNENPPTYIFNVGKYSSGDTEDPDPKTPTNPITNTTDEEQPVGPMVDVIKKAAPAPGEEVEEGDTITYTMEIFNNGGVEARNIYVKDYIPAGTTLAEVLNDGVAKDNYVEWMIENLAAGAKTQVSFKVTVDGPNDGREVENQALYEDNWDGTKTGEPENSTNNVKHPVKQGFTNIRILKVDMYDTGKTLKGAEFILYKEEGGQKVYYSKDAEGNVSWITGQNDAFILKTNSKGIANVTGLTTEGTYYIKETKAPNKYKMDKRAHEVVITREGLETTYEITIVNAPDPNSGYLLDELKANVELSKKVDKTKVAANENLTYTITVKHVGERAEITDITIMDYIPANTRFVSVENGGKYGAKNGKEYVSWKIASLKKGESIDLKFTVKVNECSGGTEIKNTAFATRDKTGQMNSNKVTSVVNGNGGNKTPGSRSNSRITSRSVKTGDDNLSLYVYAIIAILALGTVVVVSRKRRRKNAQ